MAATEWGPSISYKSRQSLVEVSQFSGAKLEGIHRSYTTWKDNNPQMTRDQAIAHLAKKEKEVRRFQIGLDFVNQLATVNREPKDVENVVIKADSTSVVPLPKEGEKVRMGAGQPFYHYEIDWNKEPVVKPVAPTKIPFEVEQGKRRAIVTHTDNLWLRRQEERRRQEELDAAETRIKQVIIDGERERADNAIRNQDIIIELGEDGIARIQYKHYVSLSFTTPDGFTLVDRETGQWSGYGSPRLSVMDPALLHHFENRARNLEGRELLKDETLYEQGELEEVYNLAKKHKIIREVRSEQSGVKFQCKVIRAFSKGYEDIDLEKGEMVTAPGNKHTRLLRPQFVEFLKQKKAELG